MSQVRGKSQKGKRPTKPQEVVPATILTEQLSTYAFGTVTAGAVMVAVAAWMGGSLASIDERIQNGLDATAKSAGFTVAKISIEGLDPRTKADVLNAVGIDENSNMFRADPFEIKERIEANVENVSEVRVLRQWPSDIWILAENRRPLALWQSEGVWHVVDQVGKPMDGEDPAEYVELPRVVGPAGGYAAPELLEQLKLHPQIADQLEVAMRVGGRRWDLRLDSGLEIALPEDAHVDVALLAVYELDEATGVLAENSEVKRIDARDPERFAVGLGEARAEYEQNSELETESGGA